MTFDIGQMTQKLMDQLMGYFNQAWGGVKEPYKDLVDAGSRARERTEVGMGHKNSLMQAFLQMMPGLLGQGMQQDMMQQQRNWDVTDRQAQTPHNVRGGTLPGAPSGGPPPFNPNAGGINMTSPTAGLWGMGTAGWGQTPESHNRQGAFDASKQWQSWYWGNDPNGKSGAGTSAASGAGMAGANNNDFISNFYNLISKNPGMNSAARARNAIPGRKKIFNRGK